MGTSKPKPSMGSSEVKGERLDSWKGIAAYLNRDQRTVRRWEAEGMPVHRKVHKKQASVYAYSAEIDAWWDDDKGHLDAAEQKFRRKRLFISVLAAAVIISLGVFAILNLGHLRNRLAGGTFAPPAIRSVAVLPLQNLSGDSEQEYFAEAMTDALITELSKISALRIISRTSTAQYRHTQKTLPEIARELNVEGVVEGSIARSGNRVRITAQLLHAPTDRHLWADTYEGDLSDVLKLQSEVAHKIVQQVRVQLTPQQQAHFGTARRVDPQAYEAFIRGRYYLSSNFRTPEGIKQAQSYFEESIQKDPTFALAYVGLADCYQFLGGWRSLSPQEVHQQARNVIDQALQLDDSLGEAHDSLGMLTWWNEWNWKLAEREFHRAAELTPNYEQTHLNLVEYFAWSGRRAEALQELAASQSLDPAWPGGYGDVRAELFRLVRDYKATRAAAESTIRSAPSDWLAHYFLGVGYQGLGQLQPAILEYKRAVDLSKGDQDALAALAYAYAVVGKVAQARELLIRLQNRSKDNYVSPYMMATIYAGLGDKEHAFEFLQKAYQEKSSDLIYFIKADLRIDSLRSDPRFESLMKHMGLLS